LNIKSYAVCYFSYGESIIWQHKEEENPLLDLGVVNWLFSMIFCISCEFSEDI